jgi:hypothetical protein
MFSGPMRVMPFLRKPESISRFKWMPEQVRHGKKLIMKAGTLSIGNLFNVSAKIRYLFKKVKNPTTYYM